MTGRRQLAIVGVVLAVIGAVGVVLARQLHTELSPLGVGARAPDFRANTLDTPPRVRTLDDYKGNVVLVNLWATWCQPCRVEIPSIERLYQTYGPRGLKVVAISVDDPGSEKAVRAFAHDMGMTFDVLHDPTGQITQLYQATGYPETVIVGRDGIIRKKIAAATDWDSEPNRRLIESLLAE